MTSEYGAIPQQDGDNGGDEKQAAQEEEVVAKAVAVSVMDEHHHHDGSDANMLPAEARDLTWTDTYYADNKVEGVIAVFDIDYEKIRRAMFSRSWIIVPMFVLYGIFLLTQEGDVYPDGPSNNSYGYLWIGYSLFMTCLVVKQVKKMSKGVIGLHVAVTKEGIRKDMNRFPLGNMFRNTTIIPYNEIKAIKAQRSCCLNNTGNVFIQSSEDDTWNGISGLTHNADAFVSLVKAMIARNAAVSIIDDVESQPLKE